MLLLTSVFFATCKLATRRSGSRLLVDASKPGEELGGSGDDLEQHTSPISMLLELLPAVTRLMRGATNKGKSMIKKLLCAIALCCAMAISGGLTSSTANA